MFFSCRLDRMLCVFSFWKVGSERVTSTNHKHMALRFKMKCLCPSNRASCLCPSQTWSSSGLPKFVNSVCVYANTIRKLCRLSISFQREQGDQPLVIHTDEPPLIAQNVISDYIIFELLQMSLMSTIHQRWALLNGV